MKLIVAFSNPILFDFYKLNKLKFKSQEIFLICPFDFIHILTTFKNKILGKSSISEETQTISHFKKHRPDLKLKTFKPRLIDIIILFPICFVKAIINTIKFKKILGGNKCQLHSNGIEISSYCLDSLQRYTGSTFKIENEDNILNIFGSFKFLLMLEIYINWFISTFKSKDVSSIIINHNVYAESGLIAEYCQSLFRSEVFLVQNVLREIIRLDDVRDHYFKYAANLMNTLEPKKEFSWSDNNSIKGNIDLIGKRIDSTRVLIMMHAFSDANQIYSDKASLFQSYYEWIKKTLEIAKLSENQEYTFRIHPSTFGFYRKDESIINKLFKDLPKNIKLEDPRQIKDQNHHFRDTIPIVVTYKGSIILELGCAGINMISISSHGIDACSIIPKNLSQYKDFLTGNVDMDKMYLNKIQVDEYKRLKNSMANFDLTVR